MLRLHDTEKGEVRELSLRVPGEVSLYVCGPTVYDVPHIGHGRSVLVYDVLRRYLEWSGLRVRHVSNVTDIDDNIIKRAAEEGRSTEAVVEQYEQAWWDALDGLGVTRPTDTPHATEYVDGMVALIGELVDKGFAYDTADTVYFDVARLGADYGALVHQSLDSLQAGARVDVEEGKRSPVDFALWKKSKPGEPSWPSPWGDGRPGWHTECVVMSLDILGDGFDLHTGGLDLKFPHHENERAQAVALGHRFAHHWMHHAFVEVAGEKMSKSLKNFTSLTDLLSRTDPRAYRLLVLQSHYRSPLEVTPETIEQAEGGLRRLDDFARRVATLPSAPPDAAVLAAFSAAMDDDLDTPRALASMFETVRDANAALDAGADDRAASLTAAVLAMCRAVGLELRAPDDAIDDTAAALVRALDEARAAKDWATGDTIRAQLQAAGWVVENTAEGTKIHR